jgi:hypothetical protein
LARGRPELPGVRGKVPSNVVHAGRVGTSDRVVPGVAVRVADRDGAGDTVEWVAGEEHTERWHVVAYPDMPSPSKRRSIPAAGAVLVTGVADVALCSSRCGEVSFPSSAVKYVAV